MCFNKRWGTIDGHGWTHTDTQIACKQLRYSAAGIYRAVSHLLVNTAPMYFLPVVSYTHNERRRYPSSYSLPTFMTLVGCYGTEERLTNCSYHKFEYSKSSHISSTSMDISVGCDTETSSSRASNEARASLSISVILAVAVIVLVAVLIIVLIMQRKKRAAKR